MSLSVGGQQPEWPAGDQRRRRSHFLLRDISKHGCLQQEPSTVILTQGGKITSLWRHQSHRGQGMVGSEGSDVQSFLFSLYLPCCLFILLWLWIVCLSVWVEMSSGWDAGTASPLGVITRVGYREPVPIWNRFQYNRYLPGPKCNADFGAWANWPMAKPRPSNADEPMAV